MECGGESEEKDGERGEVGELQKLGRGRRARGGQRGSHWSTIRNRICMGPGSTTHGGEVCRSGDSCGI